MFVELVEVGNEAGLCFDFGLAKTHFYRDGFGLDVGTMSLVAADFGLVVSVVCILPRILSANLVAIGFMTICDAIALVPCEHGVADQYATPVRQRPCPAGNTSSRPITEVKQHRAWSVSGWVTQSQLTDGHDLKFNNHLMP